MCEEREFVCVVWCVIEKRVVCVFCESVCVCVCVCGCVRA